MELTNQKERGGFDGGWNFFVSYNSTDNSNQLDFS